MEEQKPRSPRAGGAVPTQPRGIEQIIKAAVDRGASDLHIKAGDVFRARIDGKLVPLTKQRLTPEQTRAIALRLLPSDEERARIDRVRDYDCSWGAPGIGRFRVNILRQRSSFMIVLRVIPFDVPSFDSLKLPPVLTTVAAAERGMILVTGVTGSGKSSTMAAIINHINQTQNKHVVTLENPIEFLHRDISCSVTARDMIKDPNRAGELHDYIRDAREQYGMQTFDQHLMELVAEGVVAYETALAAASNPADFELQMRTLRRRPRVGPPAGAVEKPAGFSDDLSSLLPPS